MLATSGRGQRFRRAGDPSGRARGAKGVAAFVGASALLLAACGSTAPSASAPSSTTAPAGKPAHGGTIRFAETPSAPPNYIFPVNPAADQTLFNLSQFMNLMWPLMYAPQANQPGINYANSMANKPVYSKGNTVVTITMKHYMWSNGKPVTARDVIFDINLAKAAGTQWGDYVPGNFPYNLKSYTATGTYTLKFVLNKAYNPTWFTDNQLGEITPIPQSAWDKTSVSGAIGNYDTTPSGAKAVWNFLTTQAKNTSTYATNPLWKVVDGAWTLQSFGGASSPDVFVPNTHYSGKKPYASKFEEIPFTSASSEFNVLRTGPSHLSYGFLPHSDVPAKGQISSAGYKLTPIYTWGVDYMIPNLTNPSMGAVMKQLYIRQALQHLVDQKTMIKSYMSGLGIPTYGPTPVYPKGNPFVAKAELHNPYPYSVSSAESLLKSHGWKVNPGGVDVCAKGGAAGCGTGVATGTKLSLGLLVSSGTATLTHDNELFKSDAAKAGVQIGLKFQPFNTIVGIVSPCNPATQATNPVCTWQLGEYGGISYSTDPTGGALFGPGGSLNAGTYSNPTVTKLISAVHTAPTLKPYYQYESILAKQLPWIWQPVPDNLAEVTSNLTGYGITGEFTGIFGYIQPQYWYFTSKG
ncbi:MAG: ABC transporter substrate-binding protein [Acidimicrobiales bacterium]